MPKYEQDAIKCIILITTTINDNNVGILMLQRLILQESEWLFKITDPEIKKCKLTPAAGTNGSLLYSGICEQWFKIQFLQSTSASILTLCKNKQNCISDF